jgi:hydroxyacylglutathione hydrolase
MLEVTPVPAFSDNYIWLVHGVGERSRVAVVDPGDAAPVNSVLDRDGLKLDAILITHHHPDHVGGVEAILRQHPAPVYGPRGECISTVDHRLGEGDECRLPSLNLQFRILDVPGHTAGHIAYFGHGAVFCGDTLFVAGCGRLFEGTPAQMTQSLQKLAALPANTQVFCAHEYTLSNLRFAQAVEPDNTDLAAFAERAQRVRARGLPTVPSTIGIERAINPFLRCGEPAVQSAAQRKAGQPLADNTAVFGAIRRWKDNF